MGENESNVETVDDSTNVHVQMVMDDEGRLLTHLMSDRELLEEAVTKLRATEDMISRFLEDFKSGKIGGPFGMLGKMMGR